MNDKINYKYIPNHQECNCLKIEATQQQIEKGRQLYCQLAKNTPNQIGFRSCYECNTAHYYLMENFVFNCFSCGTIYVNGIDVMDYNQEQQEDINNA